MQVPIERFRLENGLRVILSPDPSLPVVAVNLWYAVGSRNERPGRTGFAHLFEHMMFQGSQNVPDTAHIAHVERMGGSVNGSTWFDRTNYYETVPAHYLERALWLEADRMGYFLPALTRRKLDTQRDVVKNERRWRVDNQPYGDWDERLQALVFPSDHPYHHPVIGRMEDLDAATLDDVRDFFRTYYAPGNAVLTLAGDLDPARARSLVERHFGPIPAGPPVPPLPGRTEIPLTLGGSVEEVVEDDVGLPRIYLGFRIPPYGSGAFRHVHVAADLLAVGKASLLYRTLVRERRLAQDVAAFAFPLVTGASLMVVWATVAPGRREEDVQAAVDEVVEGLGRAGPSPGELARTLTGIEARQRISLQQVAARADQLSMFTSLFDDPGRINTELEQYRQVRPGEVREAVGRYLAPENRARLRYRPRAGEVAA